MAQSRLEQIEAYLVSIIRDRRDTWDAHVLRLVLKQLSYVYRVVVQFRLGLYRQGIIRSHTPGIQVISVGNLTVGGTGKTPIVEAFARLLQKSGRKVAILSRGYKRVRPPLLTRLVRKITLRAYVDPPLVVSDGKRLLLDSAKSGDEPYMLASNLPDVAVLVDKDRVKSCKYAINKLHCDTLVLDDGFQYMALRHRTDIVLVDCTNPFGNRHLLPRGILREPVKNIKRAGFIFITKCNGNTNERLVRQLRELNPDAEISECCHCPRYLQDVYTGEQKALEKMKGCSVGAVSAIAVPGGFENELMRLGASIVYSKRYPDHHRYTQQEILEAINHSIAAGAEMLLTTEKDAVRYPLIERRDIPIFFMRVEIEMLSGAEAFHDWVARICFQ
jgi:tetraacyldisaccharide 4'-kinase